MKSNNSLKPHIDKTGIENQFERKYLILDLLLAVESKLS